MASKKAPSKHSRASRRATSPSIDTDKSLKQVSLPESRERPSVLAARHSGGVTKKRGTRKSQPSAKSKRRQEKGASMAEAVVERTGRKLEKSIGKARVVQARRKGWDEVNRVVDEQPKEDEQGETRA